MVTFRVRVRRRRRKKKKQVLVEGSERWLWKMRERGQQTRSERSTFNEQLSECYGRWKGRLQHAATSRFVDLLSGIFRIS